MQSSNYINRKLAVIYPWIIFLIWPFGMLLVAMKNFSIKKYRFFILLFFAFYGFTFIINNPGVDSYRHKEQFEITAQKPISELYNILTDFIYLRGEDLDVYAPLANFVVSRFTDNSSYVFALHALVFGFFYLKSIIFLFDEFQGKVNKNAFLFLFMFITLFSIHQINAVRYYTSLWIWVYGALNLLSKRELKYIFLCLMASLVHFGITPATVVLLIFYILGVRNEIYIPLVIFSFVAVNLVPLDFFVNIGSGINSAAEKRAESYTNLDIYEQRLIAVRETSWFIQLRTNILQYYIVFALAYVYVKRKYFIWDYQQRYLYSFLLLYLSFVNFVINVPSFGGRMTFIFWVIVACFFFRFFQLNHFKKIHLLTIAGVFPILLWAAVEFRAGSEFTSVLAVFGNPLLLILPNNDISLYDILFKK